MEKRVYTLELLVEQNSKLIERLDNSMAQLSQAVSDLRVDMIQGQAALLALLGFLGKHFIESYFK